jgi:hypothetical protein
MGYCDPKAVRAGKPWCEQVKEPGFMNGGKTGWPPGLLQDDCSKLSKWLSNRMDAREVVRRNVAEQQLTDAITHGVGVTLNGKRIDPTELYIEPNPTPPKE